MTENYTPCGLDRNRRMPKELEDDLVELLAQLVANDLARMVQPPGGCDDKRENDKQNKDDRRGPLRLVEEPPGVQDDQRQA